MSKVYLKSHHGRYLCAEQSGKVIADRDQPREWEEWTMTTTHSGKATFLSRHGKYLCAEPSGKLVADRDSPREWEHFSIEYHGPHVALRSHHGRYVCSEDRNGHFKAVADRTRVDSWEKWSIVPAQQAPPQQHHHHHYHHAPPPTHGSFPHYPPQPQSGCHSAPAHERKVYLKSHHGRYLCVEPSGKVVGDRQTPKEWETFTMRTASDGRVSFQTHHGTYLGATDRGALVAKQTCAGTWEHFTVEHCGHHMCLRSCHGKYVCAEPGDRHYAVVCDRTKAAEWERWEVCSADSSCSQPPPTYAYPPAATPYGYGLAAPGYTPAPTSYPPAAGGFYPPAASGYPTSTPSGYAPGYTPAPTGYPPAPAPGGYPPAAGYYPPGGY